MRAASAIALLALAAVVSTAPPPQKEKPSIMLGIKRSVLSTSTTTVSTADSEPSTTKAPQTKKPYADTFVKIPEKPLYEKKPVKPVKIAEVAKKSVAEAEVSKEVAKKSVAEVEVPKEVQQKVSEVKGEVVEVLKDEEKKSDIRSEEVIADQESSIPDVPGIADGQVSYTDQFENDKPKQNSTIDSTTDVYDNSQHGKENYRVHVKGFTFLMAPSETILGAAMLMSGLEDKENSVQGGNKSENKMQKQKESFSRLMQFLHGYKSKHDSQK